MRVEQHVRVVHEAPTKELEGLWDSIVVDPSLKDRLVNQTLLSLELRGKLPFHVSALHGVILLAGPPGTGKTTLARSLGQEISPVTSSGSARVIEVDPHGLMSAEHGQSQQAVSQLLSEHVPSLAADGIPTIVVIDEIESMAVARSVASLSANPADVHRATDAVLAAVDANAMEHPHLVTVVTSNFTGSLDEAFKSRADCLIDIPLPSEDAIVQILRRTLDSFSAAYPPLAGLAALPQLIRVAKALVGVDGRRARKVVTEAMSLRRETVLDPGQLTLEDLETAAGGLVQDRESDAAA